MQYFAILISSRKFILPNMTAIVAALRSRMAFLGIHLTCQLKERRMKLLSRISAKPGRLSIAGALFVMGMTARTAFAVPDITVSYISIASNPRGTLSQTISADGRFVAYKLGAELGNIYLIDRQTGVSTQVNLMLNGTAPAKARCDSPAISGDGRYVVFGCNATDMGAGVQGDGYFVYDRINRKTEVVALPGPGVIQARVDAAISADGHYVAYRTYVGVNSYSLQVRNMISKSTVTTAATSVLLNVLPAPLFISSDGRFVSYEGREKASVARTDLFVYDRNTAVTERITTGPVANSSVSDDGNVFAFRATGNHVYVLDRSAGKTDKVSGFLSGSILFPRVSGNGRYVSFVGSLTQGAVLNLYVHDRLTKLTRTLPSANSPYVNVQTSSFSADGRYLAFDQTTTKADNTVIGKAIGIADLGAAAGLNLSNDKLSLIEGGTAATYSAVLAQVPDADVTVTMAPGAQLSLARTQLTFTPENWSVPQIVSVQALNDGVAQGPHASSIKHTVSSPDIAYTVVKPATVTAAITDAVVPTVATPATPWAQSELPLTGTAAPGATVLLTALNRSTGWQTSVSVLADAQGKWSYMLTGLSDGVHELDVQADGIKGVALIITVALPKPVEPTNPGGPAEPGAK